MPLKYSEIFGQNEDFQRAVNLSLDQGSLALVDRYIPTVASAYILGRYLRAATSSSSDRSSLLIGPYGKGKSHTLFVAIAILSEDGDVADDVFERLAERMECVDEEVSGLIRQIRNQKIRLLPIIVNDRYLDIRQAFLASLKSALSLYDLDSLMPNNYFHCCLDTIERWKNGFSSTYEAYIRYLKNKGIKQGDFESKLRQYDIAALSQFRNCHREILAGAEFEPLIESDVPTLYKNVADTLLRETRFSGMFVVFDEFGKYLESTTNNGDRFKALQDLAEICSRSSKPIMMLSCISHKAISEYASHLSPIQKASFRTVEGRFEPIYFTTTFEGSFSLIAGALGRKQNLYKEFIEEHIQSYQYTIDECDNLGCFAGYESTVEQIAERCFPMHPLTTLMLMKLSEKAAQNERTLFTFISGTESPLNAFIEANNGEYSLATVPMIYDYFHTTIRENSYDDVLKGTIIHADSLIPTVDDDASAMIKAIVLFSMVSDSCLLATKPLLCAALQWEPNHVDIVVQNLEKSHQVYTRRSDGVVCLMRSATESVRQDIEHEISIRHGRVDIADQLAELQDPGYTIPRRYNDRFEIVRYFQNVFVSTNQFFKQRSSDFLKNKGFADGYTIFLIGDATEEDVIEQLKIWNDESIFVVLSTKQFTGQSAIEECAAIKRLLDNPNDEVAKEELSYYYEDMLQMVNGTYSALFHDSALLISMNGVHPCDNISSQISQICEDVLYSATPVICHEMINRSAISGQMKQSRAKVIDAVFASEDFLEKFPVKTAEGPIIRAVLGHSQDEKMQCVHRMIADFVSSCEENKQPLAILYDKLMSSPYGLRKGVIPILLAYCLKDNYQNSTLYINGEEIPLNGESLNALDDHYAEYELLVDKGSSSQMAYLQSLHNCYTSNESVLDLRHIYEAMCKIVRALPRSARANRKTIVNGQVSNITQFATDVRNVLIRISNNPRDILLNQLPRSLGFIDACEGCAQSIIKAITDLGQYTANLSLGIKQALRQRMDAANVPSVRGIMNVWMQRQPTARMNHAFSRTTTALMNVIRNQENHTDYEWINMIAIALTALPIEDWSDRQVTEFCGLLNDSLSEVENVNVCDDQSQSDSRIRITIGATTIDQSLPNMDLEGLGSVAYESVRSTLNEFADSLSTEEKLFILANMILHINE